MRVLRLITTYDCHRNCENCCNKQFIFEKDMVPFLSTYETPFCAFDQVILTGGEPLLHKMSLMAWVHTIKRSVTDTKLIVYTSKTDEIDFIEILIHYVDGLTVSIHNQEDMDDFMRLNFWLLRLKRYIMDNNVTLRLNVQKGVEVKALNLSIWRQIKEFEMLEICPLPSNEIIRQIR